MKRPKQSTDGFTLLEMAIVVLIMGSMAAMIAPGLSEWMADARASAAAQELVRLNRVIRVRVNDTGLAHLFVFRASDDAEGSNALGKISVWEGMNNHCNQTPWRQTMVDGKPEEGHIQIDGLDLGDSAYNLPMDGRPPAADDSGRQVVRVVPNIDPKSVIICFEPGGNTLMGISESESPIGFRFTPQTQSVVFSVTRTISYSGGTPQKRGVTREVIYPAGGNGRLRF
ncbi:MAG TPA: type II secretion system protein [Polyangiales bacterium]|nr:type II secretion system protein [Polyangiales bacterium]